MYDWEPQMGTDGKKHEMTPSDGVPIQDGIYIYELCKRVRPARTLEVGFAEGYSTLFFLAAASSNGTGSHFAIDPFEISYYNGLGLQKVRETGMMDRFRHLDAKSLLALSELASEGLRFEIIFIDGDHRFDAQLADFMLADLVCAQGGYLLLHDKWMNSTKKLVSFISRNRPDYVQLNGTDVIAAFQKRGEDVRDWRHFEDF